MMNKTAYLNGLTKRKQLQIGMESLRKNLKNMKSINKKSIELDKHQINTGKTKYLTSRRIHEIDLENAILAQKMQKIITSPRNEKYYSSNKKYSKSLNGFVKRITQQKINQQNSKFLNRLEQSKPTYQTKKILKQFEHIQTVERIMSNSQFYLTDSPNFRRRRVSSIRDRTFMSRGSDSIDNNSMFSNNNQSVIEDITMNDGRLWQIKIVRDEREIKITGQMIMGLTQKEEISTQIRLITIPYIEANLFLKRHCQNKLKKIVNFLKVDEKDNSLLLIVPQKNNSPSKLLMNPEDKHIINQKKGTTTQSNKLNSNQQQQNKIKPRQAVQNLNHKVALASDLQNLSKQNSKKKQTKKEENKDKLPSISSKRPSQASKKQTQQKQSIKSIKKSIKSQSVNQQPAQTKGDKIQSQPVQNNMQQSSKLQKQKSKQSQKSLNKKEEIKVQEENKEEEYEQNFDQDNKEEQKNQQQQIVQNNENIKQKESKEIEEMKGSKNEMKESKPEQINMDQNNKVEQQAVQMQKSIQNKQNPIQQNNTPTHQIQTNKQAPQVQIQQVNLQEANNNNKNQVNEQVIPE